MLSRPLKKDFLADLLKDGIERGEYSQAKLVQNRLLECPVLSTLTNHLQVDDPTCSIITNLSVVTSALFKAAEFPDFPVYERTGSYMLTNTDPKQQQVIDSLRVSASEAKEIEKNSRRQAESETWFRARKFRLTSSKFGLVVKRVTPWSKKSVSSNFADRNLDRNPAVKWGRTHEATAVRIYKKTMKKRGRDVVVMDCGIVIPAEYWLATSPDRRVFDPCERDPHGIIEVKCPYSL